MCEIDVRIEHSDWSGVGFVPLAERAARATLDYLDLELDECQFAILACDDAAVALLNQQYRGKDSATNVLSWPSQELAAEQPGETPRRPTQDPFGETELGDIAIAYETCLREAEQAGKPMADHVTHLIVHGLLHLLGYDHIRDADATLMEGLEVAILGKMGLDNPYTDSHGS